MPAISVCIITYNNARTIEMALKSVQGLADEIIVVDSFSTDSTPEIVKRYTDNFEQRPWPGFRDQYNYCISKARNEWVLFIDADEAVSPELCDEIRQRLIQDAGRYAGYIAHRRNFYLGRWIMHGGWVPDCEVRLFRKDRGGFKGDLHANVKVEGRLGELVNFYYHYNYKDIAGQIETINLYSKNAANDMLSAGKGFKYIDLLLRPPFRFIKEYLFKQGFRDGLPGLVIAVSTAYYVFIKYAKLWELERGLTEREN
ncbi:MAG: SPBc2 prophage-derived glycosyltransferase SunS [Deltaproteobacteria bacterium ADurb.Bin510]|nr:MAG: SPBc2 prophage-derived glycosyltransferase SunS [Deltaproteobacteria bacterium ADurb.Bin510]